MLAHKSIMQLTDILSDFKLNINAYKTTEILWGLTTFPTTTEEIPCLIDPIFRGFYFMLN